MLDRFHSTASTHAASRPPAFAQPPRDRWVLVIDDDSAILNLTHDALVAEGLDVVTASSGPIALDLLWSVDHDQPDLIILDLDLPELDGLAIASLYARIPVPHAPILVYSGNPDAAQHAEHINAAGVLPKPFDVEELISTTSDLIAVP